VELLPDLGQEVEKRQEEGVEGVEPAVEAAWRGNVGEEVQVFGEGQGPVVLAAEFHGGGHARAYLVDGQGEDGGCRCFGLGVILVAQGLESIVDHAKGRYDTRKHGGHYFFRPRIR
jgi:hypothetical protein